MLIRRCIYTQPKYVEKVKLLEYWRVQDDILRKEFFRSKLLLMVDQSPLVAQNKKELRLAVNSFADVKKQLGDYGVQFDINNSCLLDAVEEEGQWTPLFGTSVRTQSPPDDAPVDKKQVIRRLGESLGGRFYNVRSAMFMVSSEKDRVLLSRFYSLTKWAHIFCRCPHCASALITKISKSSALCRACDRTYYPQISPAIITLLRNTENSHILLVRQKNYTPGMYTCIAGFSNVGETLQETVRREVAEEVGIELEKVNVYNYSQPWPLPDGSLMLPHVSVGSMQQQIDKCPAELEAAAWFSREEVQKALDRTIQDPTFKNVPKDIDSRQSLLYIPPSGAVAHHLIREWLDGKL